MRTPYAVDPDLWMFHMKFGDRDHLQEAADHRQRMVEADGRSRDTQWRQGGDTLVDLLERITQGPTPQTSRSSCRRPGRSSTHSSSRTRKGNWRAPEGSQMKLMENRPLVRIPQRFHGIV